MQPSQSGQPYDNVLMVERQMLLHDALDRAVQPHPSAHTNLRYRFITISRDKGSFGDAIAEELAKRLGWSVFDKEVVDYIAHNSHVRQHLVQQLDEKARNLVHETIQRFLRMAEGGSFGIAEYRESLLKTLAYLAMRGESVIVGRGSNFALRNEMGGLHLRIVASARIRAERLSLRWHISPEEARWRMDEMDAERRNFIRHHFKKSIDDPCAYDLMFNTDNLTPAQVVDSLMGTIGISSSTTENKPRLSENRIAEVGARSA
jgi:cytidylate kinase